MSVRKFLTLISVLALVGAACKGGGGGGTETAKGGTLTFGAALSLTGSLAREGILTKEGYEYFRKVINEKGGVKVGGKTYTLAIKYQDDRSTPDVAAQLVDQMNDAGIKFILGPYGSASTQAASAVVERNQQLMVSTAGADDKIYTQGYKYTFGVLSPASFYVASIVKAVAELATPKPKTVAVLAADDGFSQTAAQAGAQEAQKQGMQVVAQETFPASATDLTAQITKIKPKKPDLVLSSGHLQDGIGVIKAAEELRLNPAGGFGETVAPPTPDFVQSLGKAAELVLGSSQWSADVEGKDSYVGTAQDYANGIKQMFGHDAEYHNAEATAGALAMVLAIQRAGSLEPAAVRNAMASLDTMSFFGQIKFDGQGKNVYKPMTVIQIQDGQAVTVWPKGPNSATLQWPTPPFGQR